MLLPVPISTDFRLRISDKYTLGKERERRHGYPRQLQYALTAA